MTSLCFFFCDDGLVWQLTTSQNLEDTGLGDVDDGDLVCLCLVVLAGILGDQRPHLVDVDSGAEVGVPLQVENSHTVLAEIARVVFEEVDAVVMHATSVTTTSRVLSVLSNTSMTCRNVSALFSVLSEAGSHD